MLVALPHSVYWWGVRAFDHDGRLVAVSTAWPVQVVIAGASGRPPTLPTPSPEPDRVISLISLSFPWRLAPNQTVFYLPVDEPGEIVVSTAWQGTQRELVITLDAPGQPAPFARQEGPSPLQLHYLATEEDVEGAYRWWRVTISSPGDGIAAAGALAMMYPGSRLSGMFNVAPDVGAVVIVLPVAGPGRVSATAAWEGAPASLVMQLDGPRLARPLHAHGGGRAAAPELRH
ncbi:MAG: hypothetical protein M5R40_23120 [Anaerolineae bacterium]|nr:hypothetical protein [Anaerolineae bacterium]